MIDSIIAIIVDSIETPGVKYYRNDKQFICKMRYNSCTVEYLTVIINFDSSVVQTGSCIVEDSKSALRMHNQNIVTLGDLSDPDIIEKIAAIFRNIHIMENKVLATRMISLVFMVVMSLRLLFITDMPYQYVLDILSIPAYIYVISVTRQNIKLFPMIGRFTYVFDICIMTILHSIIALTTLYLTLMCN